MDFRKISPVNKQNFTKLCLVLFKEYRSAKFKGDHIIFWKRNNYLLDSRVVIPFSDLIFKHIPMQLSYFKWRSNGKYNDYLDEINFIFENNHEEDVLRKFNNWYMDQIDGILMMNISTSFCNQERIFIQKDSYKRKSKIKINIKNYTSDVIDPLIQRVSQFQLDSAIKTVRLTLQFAMIALLIKTHVVLTVLPETEIEIASVKKEVDYEKLFCNFPIIKKDTQCKNNNRIKMVFDTS